MPQPSLYLHPRDEILQAMERIYRYRMTTTSGGNLSLREPNGDVWITPARVDKGGLQRDDIVRVRPSGEVDGIRKPSSELPIHQQIRERRPELEGIVHAHPVALVAFSLAHEVPNTRLFHQAWRICGAVGFAPYKLPGSAALGAIVADTFAQGFDCVILENHGVVTAGVSLQEAFRRFETLEFTAKTIIKARLLGGEVRFLTDDELELESRRAGALDEMPAAAPSSAENEVRRRLSRVHPPRLPPAPVHQHARELLGARGRVVVRDHAVSGGSRRGRRRGSGAGARRPLRSGQAAQPRRRHSRRDLPRSTPRSARSSMRIR